MPPEIDYWWWKAGPVETAWIAVVGLALFVNFLLLKVAWENRKAVQESHTNGIREYAAETQLWREILRITGQLALLAMGIRAAMLPNYEGGRTPDYFFFIGCLMFAAVMKAAVAIFDWTRFRTLLQRVNSVEAMARIAEYERKGRGSRSTDHPFQ